ncbi:hypothetical protein A9G13_07425 [Gilliamella sp. wkB178]|uniref:acyltransferase n=1 Tax=Gilliamella sp. wkB178 TaxID=3120259 RepID=UPI00080EA64A|nr:acyltransferase family protein [Gilliamella apicola]OCG08021.1 hypothetical protein A9G13_07425 [Gilliamella apicola]
MVDNRIYYLDHIRVIAIFLVVFTHCHENIPLDNLLVKSFFYSVDRMAVPLFFMISGGLLLSRDYTNNIRQFYIQKTLRFMIVLILFAILTNIISEFITTDLSFASIIKTSIKYHNGIYPTNYGSAIHLWFMYPIILLYLVTPFVSNLVKNSSTKSILFLILIGFLLNQGNFFIKSILPDMFILNLMGNDFTGPYLSYFLFGYIAINRFNRNYGNQFLLFLLISITIIVEIYLDKSQNNFIEENHWYSTSLYIAISSCLFFLFLKNINFLDKKRPFIMVLSNCVFGIYLIHVCWIYIIIGILTKFNLLEVQNYLLLFIYLIFSINSSFFSIYVLKKMKFFNFIF